MQRRDFLKGLGATFALSSLPHVNAFAINPQFATAKREEILVFVFMKGGADGLQLAAPIGDTHYIQARAKDLRIPEEGALGLGQYAGLDFFMHPKAKALRELYQSKDLALVHATGLQHGTRSHFQACNLLELGYAQPQAATKGWMTRFLETLQPQGMLPAVTVGNRGLSAALLGAQNAAAIDNIKETRLNGEAFVPDLLATFYKGNTALDQQAQHTLSTIKTLQEHAKDAHVHQHEAHYPTEGHIEAFSEQLKQLATLIRMEVGVQMAVVELDGWDHHDGQAHHFPKLLEGFSKALAAFYNDLQAYHKRLTIVAMSEFGRRVRSNRSGGTDHGHGGLAFVLGGAVKGGRIYGDWPGLSNDQLDRSVDLQVTTDYRLILQEILAKRFKADQLDFVFPDLVGAPTLGFL